jgi:hypothetical protein
MSAQPQVPTCNPLTDEHCQLIDITLQGCSLQDELIGKCQQAGVPGIDPYIKDNNRRKQFLSGVKAAFFPDRP